MTTTDDHEGTDHHHGNTMNLEELRTAMLDRDPSVMGTGANADGWSSDLPTFGGSDAHDAHSEPVWSWSETHLLIGASDDELRIVPREDHEGCNYYYGDEGEGSFTCVRYEGDRPVAIVCCEGCDSSKLPRDVTGMTIAQAEAAAAEEAEKCRRYNAADLAATEAADRYWGDDR